MFVAPQASLGRVTAWWSSRRDGTAVAGWALAAALGVSVLDYAACALPLLNALLPAAFQALGVAAVAWGALRYLKERASPQEDAAAAGAALAALLPGIDE